MAFENPTWGYTGHQVARSTISKILKAHGVPPTGEPPTSWDTFLRAHWDAIAGAAFFTTEVWTLRGLVTYYTLFVIELHSRRVRILGCTPHPDEAFMLQMGLQMTDPVDGIVGHRGMLICDRDRKWSAQVRQLFEGSGFSERRFARQTTMRTRSILCARSRKNAWTGSFPWGTVTFVGPFGSLSRTITASGITKLWATYSLIQTYPRRRVDGFSVDNVLVDC
jgi:hypothetical protein